MLYAKKMRQADRPKYYAQIKAQVTNPRKIFEQRMRIAFNRLVADERRPLKEKTDK